MVIIYEDNYEKRDFFERQKNLAYMKCEVCPGCNALISFSNSKNIVKIKKFKRGIFRNRRAYIQIFFCCHRCDSIWATEPWLYDCKINRRLYERGNIQKYALK